MAPNFNNKDLIITSKFFYNLKVHDVILLDIPIFGIVLKRIYFLEDNLIKVKGDNTEYDLSLIHI